MKYVIVQYKVNEGSKFETINARLIDILTLKTFNGLEIAFLQVAFLHRRMVRKDFTWAHIVHI